MEGHPEISWMNPSLLNTTVVRDIDSKDGRLIQLILSTILTFSKFSVVKDFALRMVCDNLYMAFLSGPSFLLRMMSISLMFLSTEKLVHLSMIAVLPLPPPYLM